MTGNSLEEGRTVRSFQAPPRSAPASLAYIDGSFYVFLSGRRSWPAARWALCLRFDARLGAS